MHYFYCLFTYADHVKVVKLHFKLQLIVWMEQKTSKTDETSVWNEVRICLFNSMSRTKTLGKYLTFTRTKFHIRKKIVVCNISDLTLHRHMKWHALPHDYEGRIKHFFATGRKLAQNFPVKYQFCHWIIIIIHIITIMLKRNSYSILPIVSWKPHFQWIGRYVWFRLVVANCNWSNLNKYVNCALRYLALRNFGRCC